MTTLQPHGPSREEMDPFVGAALGDAGRIDLAAYRVILDAIGQMAWVNAPDGSLRFFNRYGVAYLGVPNDALEGRRWIAYLHDEDRELVAAVRAAAIAAGEPYVAEGRFRRHDGAYRWQRFDVQPVRAADGRLEGWIGSARDIHDERMRAEERAAIAADLRERDERLRAALDAAHLGTFRWDIRTNALDWDDNLDRLFGLEPGQTVRSLDGFVARVHPDDRAAVVAACERCAREGADFDMELRVTWPDGSVRWLHDKGRTHRGADGRPAYMTGACIDVTERRREQEALRALLETMPQLVWSADARGHVDYFNARWREYTGVDLQRLVEGLEWPGSVHPDDAPTMHRLWERSLADGEPYEIVYRLRRHDGAYRWFMGRAVPTRDAAGNLLRWFGSCTDIHDEVMLREESVRLTESERRARDEAQRANAAKSAFLAMMSHDLRTPINATLGYVDLMTLGIRGPMTPEQLTDLERIRQSQRMLLALVNEVLEYTRIESGRLEVRRDRLPLDELLADVAAVIQPLAAAKGLRLEAPPAPALDVTADRDRVRQVLLNLLGNAVKFTHEGTVRLTGEAAGTHVAIRVSDTGRGIAPDRLGTIFAPFVQGSPADAAGREGVGLGLAIARELAQAMGGDVTAESEAGRGSTFTFSVPVA